MVQWTGLHASPTEGLDLIPGQGTMIPCAVWPKKYIAIFKKNSHCLLTNKWSKLHLNGQGFFFLLFNLVKITTFK